MKQRSARKMTRAAFLRTPYLILRRAGVKHEFTSVPFGRARSPSAPKETDGPAVRPYQVLRHERSGKLERFKEICSRSKRQRRYLKRVRRRTDSPWRTCGSAPGIQIAHADDPESFRGSQCSIGADRTGIPEVNRAFSAKCFFDFHNPWGAAPGFDVNVAPSALEAIS
jgi:hypothetical protein